MTYVYGTKGAPAVGGGLPGLPRREQSSQKQMILTPNSISAQTFIETIPFSNPGSFTYEFQDDVYVVLSLRGGSGGGGGGGTPDSSGSSGTSGGDSRVDLNGELLISCGGASGGSGGSSRSNTTGVTPGGLTGISQSIQCVLVSQAPGGKVVNNVSGGSGGSQWYDRGCGSPGGGSAATHILFFARKLDLLEISIGSRGTGGKAGGSSASGGVSGQSGQCLINLYRMR